VSGDGRRIRWILVFGVAGAAYAAVLYWTGGFETDFLGRKLRSRAWERPAVAAVALVLIWLALELRRSPTVASRAWSWLNSPMAAALITTMAIVWTLLAGLRFGTFAAGGSDSYCYVSQAHLFADGALTEEVVLRPEFTWRDAGVSLIPLGYRPAALPGRMAPVCPPGFSLLMATVRPFGDRVMFLLVPVFGAVIMLCTAIVGRQLGHSLAGAVAALLLSLSATFLLMLFAPMSDVPATALWLGALVIAFSRAESVSAPAASGVLAGLAILTRPNLAPLAVIPFGMWLARGRWTQVVPYIVPVVAAAGTIGWMQAERFGNPFLSGYGDTGELFAVSHVAANARTYAARLTTLYTPLIWLSVAAPLILWGRAQRRVILAISCTVAATWIAYLVYLPFEPWFFTRFLLPAIPLMLLFAAIVAFTLIERLPSWGRTPAAVALSLVMSLVLLEESRRRGVFTSAATEQKYPQAAAFVRDELPQSSYVLARQHSGSIRLYAGRPTIRWDAIGGDQLDVVVQQLRSIGAQVHVVVDDDEWTPFTTHFAGQIAPSRLRQLAVFGQARVYAVE
jgi:hypothetical protein